MRKISRRVQKELQGLAGTAYERELNVELDKLLQNFGDWKAGQTDCFELSAAIRRFHDGPNRQLFVHYNTISPSISVVHALDNGILRRDEIQDEVWEYIKGAFRFVEESKRANQSQA